MDLETNSVPVVNVAGVVSRNACASAGRVSVCAKRTGKAAGTNLKLRKMDGEAHPLGASSWKRVVRPTRAACTTASAAISYFEKLV